MDKITRVTTVKEMLQEEFGNNIGFHERIHKNKNIIVYNKADCGTFIDAALHSLGISDKQLIYNVAKRLHDKGPSIKYVRSQGEEGGQSKSVRSL